MKNVETWKNVVGYEDKYKVSSLGNVLSIRRMRLLTPTKSKSGYLTVSLSANGKRKNFRVHRLVAAHFIENPEGKQQVNHINGNKEDNKAGNLEWCTSSENIIHSWKMGMRERSRQASKTTVLKAHQASRKKIQQYSSDDELINTFDSISDAYRHLGIEKFTGNISACCRGKLKTAYGYKWEYVD